MSDDDNTLPLPRAIQREQAELEELEKLIAERNAGETPPEPTQAPEPEPQAPVPPPAPEEVPEEKWETKYRRLQGKYDAEVPRLHNEVRELRQLVDELRAPKPEPKAPEPEPQRLVTADDVETFGEDLIELQRRIVREEAAAFQAKLDAMQQENATLRQRVEKTGSDVSQLGFSAQLARLVPDFAAIDADPRWIAWLDEADPMLRGPRRAVAQAAFNSGDADAVAHYVSLFRKSIEAPATTSRQAELQRQVQPSRVNTATVDTSTGKTYTEAEANALFDRVRKLTIAGEFDKATALENEISLAYTEGRVRV